MSDGAGQRLDLRGGLDQPEVVPEPLHQRAGHRDRALQRVHRGLPAQLVRHRGEQAVLRGDRTGAGVQQQEAPGAVGALGLAGGEAGLAEQRGLLVAQRGRDRHPGQRPAPGPVGRQRRPDLRQHRRRQVEELQRPVPGQGVDVHQQGPAGVGHLGDVRAAVDAAGEVPDQPGVHRAERDVAALGAFTQARGVVEQPAQPRRAEVGGDRQPAELLHPGRAGAPGELLDDPVGAGVLPHDGPVHRASGVPVPDDHGLALVGDPDRGHVGGGRADPGQHAGDHLAHVGQISAASCSIQPGWG